MGVPGAVNYTVGGPAEHFLDVLYQAAPWAAHRNLEACREALKNSWAYVIAYRDGKPIGCGRVISDGVTRAFIEDVAVLQAERRNGIGKQIVVSLELSCMWSVERIELTTIQAEFWAALGYVEKPPKHRFVKLCR